MIKKFFISTILLFPIISFGQSVMSSDSYKMQSDSLNFAGLLGASANYRVEDTLGELVSGTTTSSDYIDFQGYQFMGFASADTEAPTAPSSLTAQALSTSEVELTWGASTDNIAVDRYYIYRNGSRIDDVAIFPRSFSDTGLSANTTYSYNVSAVDDSGNESLWSSTTTATTLGSGGVGTGGTRTVFITDLLISSNDVNALITFNTSISRSVEVHWGRDTSYADGVLVGGMTSEHSFLLDGLLPETFYHLKFVLKDEYGNAKSLENISFRTLSVPLSQSPVNVTNFSATQLGDNINLTWAMPTLGRVIGVKILRREDFYPATPTDGELVFESLDGSRPESFLDTNVERGKDYFYTIFAQDLAGNTSSGVVASGRVLLSGEVRVENPLDKLLPAGSVDPIIGKLEIADFLFIQSGDSVDISGGSVFVRGDKNLTVALRYHRVPEVLKTIAVTLVTRTNPEKSFSFILRPNRDKTRYEATVGALGKEAVYTLRIDIVDFKNQGLKTLRGTLEVVTPFVLPFSIPKNFLPVFGVVFVFGMIALALYFGVFLRSKRLPLINTT